VDYSLARRTPDGLLLHRLVQDVTRHVSGPGCEPLPVALALLRAGLPKEIVGAPDSWPRWRQLLPHVLAVTGYHDDTRAVAAVDTAWLLNGAGLYLWTQDRPADALLLCERALRIHETAYGPDHPEVATGLTHLDWVLRDLGRPATALPLCERALGIHEAALGPDHPYVATDLTSLGQTLRDLGRPADALLLCERALRIHETAYGPDHPKTIQSSQNLHAGRLP
jgi:tetratricopeptide (TPR) repeat protein